MLTLLTGTPGSGKTLFAIDIIIKINSKEAKEFSHIKTIYNNISGFKYEKYLNEKLAKLAPTFPTTSFVLIKVVN
jgi:tRNA uridine 5-carbamoylmethylation protein Kti12